MAKPKITKSSVEQTIDLEELFGVSFKGATQLKEAIGQAIIDRIVSRTEAGVGMSFNSQGKGQTLKLKSPYSKAYTKSTEFKAHGKSKNKINMKLTGDMLGLMDIKKQTGNSVTIGWDKGDGQDAKVFNHQTGDTVPRRPFFGISRTELLKIKSEFNPDVKEALSIKKDEGRAAFNKFVLGLIKEVGEE
jgi:hypothetical protein